MTPGSAEAVMGENAAAEALAPLEQAADRVAVHTRLVAPLITTVLVHTIDNYRERQKGASVSLSDRIQETFSEFKNKLEQNYENAAYGLGFLVFSSITEMLRTKEQQIFPEMGREDTSYTTFDQQTLLRRSTYGKKLNNILHEAMDTHLRVTYNLALPGYLIAHDGLSTPRQLVERVREIGPAGAGEVLGRRDYGSALSRLGLTASGLFRRAHYAYVDRPEACPALDVGAALLAEAVASKPEPMPDPITVYELYEKRPDGSIGLSGPALKALKYYLTYRNGLDPDLNLGGVRGPSRGCPVVQSSVRVCREDYTDQQWADMTEGDNPIAEYNEDSQRLTFKRSAFAEMTALIADGLNDKI